VHTTNPQLTPPTLTRSPLTFIKYQIARLTGARLPYVSFGYVPSDLQTTPTQPPAPAQSSETAPPLPSTQDPSTMSWLQIGAQFLHGFKSAKGTSPPPVSEKAQIRKPSFESQYISHPQTASYSLCDSPAGLLAIMLDGLRLSQRSGNYTSTGISADTTWTPTDLLNWTMMQWLPGPEAGLRWLANAKAEAELNRTKYSAVPLGISCFRGNAIKTAGTEPDVEAGLAANTSAITSPERLQQPLGVASSEAIKMSSAPPLWAQAVQRLCWIKRHGRCSGRPAWEEAGELAIDMKEWAGMLIEQGWMRF
jgi:hypothetical protein